MWWQHFLVAFCVGVCVHDVEICLGVVCEHLGVPGECIDAAEESAIDDGEFPVFAVVDLSGSWQYEGEPCGADGVGFESGEVSSVALLLYVSFEIWKHQMDYHNQK